MYVWGRRVATSTSIARTDAAHEVLDRVESFRDWASAAGVSLSPTFRTREAGADGAPVVVLPTTALAEYRDGELAHVTPHTDDGSVHTVAERLERLAATAPADSAADL